MTSSGTGPRADGTDRPVRVLCWSERSEPQTVYPEGINGAIAQALGEAAGFEVRTGNLADPGQGLDELDWADVLVWWGHIAHDEVTDAAVDRVQARVLDGMGFIGLHSAHYSRPFRRLMGTSCSLKWREADDRERLWVVETDRLTEGRRYLDAISSQWDGALARLRALVED